MFGSLRNNIGIAQNSTGSMISIRAISMHKIESKEISNRKYLSKKILACRLRQAKKKLAKCNATRHGPCLALVLGPSILQNAAVSTVYLKKKPFNINLHGDRQEHSDISVRQLP